MFRAAVAGMDFVVDEATLAEQLNAMLAGRSLVETPLGAAALGQVAVQLLEGRALGTGQVQVGFMRLPVSVTATADVVDGRPLVRVREMDVGGMPLPDAARQGIESQVQAEVDRIMAQRGFRVEAVTIQPGQLTVRGQPA